MSSVQVERGPVARIRLDRPEKLNAIDRPLAAALRDALVRLDADDTVRSIVLSGSGRAFCVGADLNAVESADADAHRAWVDELGGLYERLRATRKPIVAAVHGYALGAGLGLALACDAFVCAEDASLGAPEVEHGLVAGLLLVYLRESAGLRAALELVLSGRRFSGEEAVALGLAHEAVAASTLDIRALELAASFSTAGPTALRLTKRLFYETLGLPHAQQVAAGRDAVLAARNTDDAREGAAAFRERRPPRWRAE
ncbi:MAG: enoyl-CoA hydratase/isomerase family protein [Gaiellaceae bacterium]